MEIERRFIVSAFPEDLEVLRKAEVKQGYISTGEPEARIRWTKDEHKTTYKLAFKTDGTLAREEIEFDISEENYTNLKRLLKGDMITKDYRVYALTNNLRLEVCKVDEGMPTEYMYAEVEFESIEQAMAFDVAHIPYFVKEVTEDRSYNMKKYWDRTRG